MKTRALLLFLALLLTYPGFAQKLTLAELTSLCDKKSWESINSVLSSKGWVYYDSKQGDSEHYNTITWAYNKDRYSDKAQGWFYLYTYDGQPNKISLSVFNKPAFSLISSALTPAGYKLTDSEIKDGEVISTYGNNINLIEVTYQKREDDDWTDRSHTAYRVTLIKKAGVYDPDNGNKKSYYYDGELMSEYTFKSGKFHGGYKYYYPDGHLKKQGTFNNGEENGKFIDYDSLGNKEAEYYMVNGELHGVLTFYESGLKSVEKEYVNGAQTGRHVEYYYDDETEQLNLKVVGSTKNGEKHGKWATFYIGNGKEEVLQFAHYANGLKHGEASEFIGGDTLILASYASGDLHGPYKRKIKAYLIDPKTGEQDFIWVDDCEGSYKMGLKSGKWFYFNVGGKESEGNYSNDLKEGKWTYYLPVGSRAGEVMLETSFIADKKDGIEKRFFYIDEIESGTGDDVRARFKALPVYETTTYSKGLKHGAYELKDSTNVIVGKGNYYNDEKNGLWVEGYFEDMPDGSKARLYYKGEYKNDKEEGKWVAYFDERALVTTLNFKAGELHGELIEWNKYAKPSEVKNFHKGKFVSLIVYDSAGDKVLTKYDISNQNSSSFICRQTEYLEDKIISQEYKVFTQDEIDHTTFKQDFLNLTGVVSSGIHGYKYGEYKIIDVKGEPILTGSYENKDKVGLWTYYYPDQGMKMELNYKNNALLSEKYLTLNNLPFSGEFVCHNTESGLKEERKIKNGLRNGKTAYIDNNNKTVKRENYKDGALK